MLDVLGVTHSYITGTTGTSGLLSRARYMKLSKRNFIIYILSGQEEITAGIQVVLFQSAAPVISTLVSNIERTMIKFDRFWFACVSITAIECLIAAMLFMHDAFAYRLYDGYFEARFLTSWGFDLAGLACVGVCMKELGQ